ncbi:MAG: AbrB/MazE/SpoVT family DNA-binding domain-containing protein, partial [Cyanobacteria bacterium P01_G01_bin.4]
KHQVTLPRAVRRALEIKAGDRVQFDIDGDRVILHKRSNLDVNYLETVSETLGEWASAADEEAYANL